MNFPKRELCVEFIGTERPNRDITLILLELYAGPKNFAFVLLEPRSVGAAKSQHASVCALRTLFWGTDANNGHLVVRNVSRFEAALGMGCRGSAGGLVPDQPARERAIGIRQILSAITTRPISQIQCDLTTAPAKANRIVNGL